MDQLLKQVEQELTHPEAALESLEEARAEEDKPYQFPESCLFDGHAADIEIRLRRRDMEDSDVVKWGTTWAASKWYRMRFSKPPFMPSSRNYRYPLETRDDGVATVALFSDWAAGYYHSLYIARHILRQRPLQAIHLGDTYYTGSPDETTSYLEAPLQPLVAQFPVWVMNANHEMMHNAIPFFHYIKRKHGANQPQESTQFCLHNDHYQVIGIDTAYHKSGRHPDQASQAWLLEQLQAGRQQKKVNILLSQNEPYAKGQVSDLLKRDLRAAVLEQQLVDLWFWGDEHFCALYAPGPGAPFIGSCIGHGGYPYPVRKEADVAPPAGVASLVWYEKAARFPQHLSDTRHDVGNNGFCMLELSPQSISIKYIDWRNQLRYHTQLTVQNGWVAMPDAPVFVGPDGGSCPAHG
jgi:hypothetical protein